MSVKVFIEDCRNVVATLPASSVHAVITDPPFGIDYDYPNYNDTLENLETTLSSLIPQLYRVLKPGGALVMAMAPKTLHVPMRILQNCDFGFRNLIVWHYNFGVHQKRKFVPSWTGILYYVKPGADATFNRDTVLVPSARQTLYNDKRASSDGRTMGDVWFDIPRLCGTHRERVEYTCQQPLALLHRIIDVCTNEGDTILDPFCGTGTTLIAAIQRNRNAIGIEQDPKAVEIVKQRIRKGK